MPRRSRRLPARALTALLVGVAAVTALLTGPGAGAGAGSGSTTTTRLPSLASPLIDPTGAPAVSGPIRSPGGPYLYDREGRVVLFHGVNAVYKHPPFELYPPAGGHGTSRRPTRRSWRASASTWCASA